MPTRRQLIGGAAASVALAAAAAYPLGTLAQDDDDDDHDDDNQGSVTPVVGTPMLQPAIDLTRAQEIALEGNAGAAVTKVELDGEHGLLEYSVHLNNGAEVDIDATSGEIIRTEQSGDGSGGSGDDEHGDDSGDDGDDG